MNYDAALDRALEASPELGTESDRLSIPDPEGETDGAFTRLTNLPEIATALDREVEHLFSYLQSQLGTNGQFDGQQARYNGSFSVRDFDTAIDEYVAEYVLCSECGLPDTKLAVENGTQMLRCTACGAFRPVQKQDQNRSGANSGQGATVEEGKSYRVEITDTGREGDGVAKRGGYTIFVSGAREGDVVTAYIENVSGKLAFARVV
jgi:translation initiation factor 2 subunit 2